MDISLLCKIFFTLGTAVDLGGVFIPSFRQQIMTYGSRRATAPLNSDSKTPKSYLACLFDFVASFQVPHAWFTHYYIFSVLSSIFWAHQIITRERIFQYVASQTSASATGMTVNQVLLAWGFMALQGLRRLYECITLTKPSQSKMWVGIWLLGIAYYGFIGISVWIEGTAVLNMPEAASLLDFSQPSIKTFIAVPIFVLASCIQHDCHVYLASLKKYTLPESQWFKLVVCPHYTCDCLVYVSIAIVSAPKGLAVNRTVLAGLGFVVSNLAVTADSTRKWYVQKFGPEKLKGRWRMVPYVY